MHHLRTLVPSLLIVMGASSLPAQTEARIGDRARITTGDEHGRRVGVLQASPSDSVFLSGVAINRTSINRVEVSTGRKSYGWAGVGIGLLAGAGIGYALSCASYCGEFNDGETGLLLGAGAVAGGLLGGVLGGIIGEVFVHSEKWQSTSLGTLRVQPTVGPHGAPSVTIRLWF